jgi:signal transduction histidine kinase
MTTSYDYRKLLQEPAEQKLVLYIPELSGSPEISEEAVRNELRALRRSNNRLHEQLSVLEARNRELDAYAHTVAHNLKNPLAVILMIADAFSEITDLTPRELREFAHQIQTTAHDMDDIIDNLLLLAEVRKAEAPVQPVDMAEVVGRIRNRLGYLIQGRHARVHFPKTWPVAIGYAPWIEEVWSNYLSNALKYGGEPPCIKLGAAVQPDGMVRFWLRDDGPGLAPEVVARLFTPYTRVGQSQRPGHGLGLSIVKRIVEKLDGEVGVESEPGKGSLFFFTLPSGSPTGAG